MKPKPHKDTERLKHLIELQNNPSSDFEQDLFFARRKTKTELAAYRKALDEHKWNH